ncbi:MAG: hypothetical protein K2X27_11145 [Candidatus Obscuribacterales bacterium]|nr:hypothetical protein [Candidatus Obscuribacterales bacterium]
MISKGRPATKVLFALFLISVLSSLLVCTQAAGAKEKSKAAVSNKKNAMKTKTKIDEKKALSLVEARPEVKKWRQEVAKACAKRGATAQVEIDREEGSEYVVHVFEIVPDDKESSHTATLNWYYVDKNSGKIRTEF